MFECRKYVRMSKIYFVLRIYVFEKKCQNKMLQFQGQRYKHDRQRVVRFSMSDYTPWLFPTLPS